MYLEDRSLKRESDLVRQDFGNETLTLEVMEVIYV